MIILQKLQHMQLQADLEHFKASAVKSAHEIEYRMKETRNKVKGQMISQVRELEEENESLKQKLEELQERCTIQVRGDHNSHGGASLPWDDGAIHFVMWASAS